MSDTPRRKLIEVALPLEAINRESAREKSIRHGHPSTLHLWWARRPLAACRAVLFASIIDDPSSRPDLFTTETEQEQERTRLFHLIEQLVRWEAITDERVLGRAREEIRRYTDGNPPPVLDPFCGGGSIPLEAQRLGLHAHASDLNPVAVLITKALIEIPPKVRDMPPVNPETREKLETGGWRGAQGLAEDVRYYGRWMRREAEARIGHLYPKARLTNGSEATVIAWIWARTVKCPNPACGAEMPLISSLALSTKKGKQAWLEPVVDRASKTVDFEVRTGGGKVPESPKVGRGAKFRCLVCDEISPDEHIKSEGVAGRMGVRLIAIVAEGTNERVYLPAEPSHVDAALRATPTWQPEEELAKDPRNIWCIPYGLTRVSDLFAHRQIVALTTFSDLVSEVRGQIIEDARTMLEAGQAEDYADAVTTFLALVTSRAADFWSSLATWAPDGAFISHAFTHQAIRMIWDFAEANPFSDLTGSWLSLLDASSRVPERLPGAAPGAATQLDATAAVNGVHLPMISTDPPYYDNIGYADLSDFFYVWLRRSLKGSYPDLFSTLLTPKSQELVAVPHRFSGSKAAAQDHFETGLREAFARIHAAHSPDHPMTLFYAFKQAEAGKDGLASTGWETMLEGLLGSGFMVTGTWPMRTERGARSVAIGTSALASSILLVCRPRLETAALATRKEFTSALRAELPKALQRLQSGSIAPVDLAQAAIGPGMAVFSRYSKVVEADGKPMRIRTALALINEALDELLAEQEADFDADTRWCVAWFDQHGMNEGAFGVAETLSRAKNTAINGLVSAGVVESRGGKVRLLDRNELEQTWDPTEDTRLTVWEVTQHLIARHQTDGEEVAADLLRQVGGGLAEAARELAYRLFAICERKGWAQEALAYNALVTAWPEITRLAAQAPGVTATGEQEAMEV